MLYFVLSQFYLIVLSCQVTHAIGLFPFSTSAPMIFDSLRPIVPSLSVPFMCAFVCLCIRAHTRTFPLIGRHTHTHTAFFFTFPNKLFVAESLHLSSQIIFYLFFIAVFFLLFFPVDCECALHGPYHNGHDIVWDVGMQSCHCKYDRRMVEGVV